MDFDLYARKFCPSSRHVKWLSFLAMSAMSYLSNSKDMEVWIDYGRISWARLPNETNVFCHHLQIFESLYLETFHVHVTKSLTSRLYVCRAIEYVLVFTKTLCQTIHRNRVSFEWLQITVSATFEFRHIEKKGKRNTRAFCFPLACAFKWNETLRQTTAATKASRKWMAKVEHDLADNRLEITNTIPFGGYWWWWFKTVSGEWRTPAKHYTKFNCVILPTSLRPRTIQLSLQWCY